GQALLPERVGPRLLARPRLGADHPLGHPDVMLAPEAEEFVVLNHRFAQHPQIVVARLPVDPRDVGGIGFWEPHLPKHGGEAVPQGGPLEAALEPPSTRRLRVKETQIAFVARAAGELDFTELKRLKPARRPEEVAE